MRITGLHLYRYALPLDLPPEIKGKPLHNREGILLRLTGDGIEGWGEASPLPGFSRENLEEAIRQMWGAKPALMEFDLTGWPDGGLQSVLDSFDPAPSVRFGVELAVSNLHAAARKKTLPEVLGRPGREVSLNGLLSGPKDDVLKEARKMSLAGYRAIKLKVGRGPIEEDAAMVRDVAGALDDDVSLRLDANRAWTFDEALEFARATESFPYEYIEEPLADPTQLARFASVTGLPVALDESLAGMNPDILGEHCYAQAVVLKPTLLGGIHHTLRLAERAQSLGMTPVVSSAFETGVGTLGLVALAACIGGGDVPAGLDTYRRFTRDVLEPRLDLQSSVGVSEVTNVRRTVDRSRLREIHEAATRSRYG